MSSTPAKTVILFIDDEVQMRRLIRASLERNGYEVVEAATGEEGLAAAIDSQPAVIILDLGLPDMDGMTVAAPPARVEQGPGHYALGARPRQRQGIGAGQRGQ